MQAITLKKVLVDELRALVPSLSARDVRDLLKIASGSTTPERKLKAILTDYRMAGKLNKAEIDGFLKFWNSLADIFKVAGAIVGLA